MTTISLDAPLASLRAMCGISHRALGERMSPPVSDVAVIKSEHRAGRIKLATLAAYARAAGWRLYVNAAPILLRKELERADADSRQAQRAATHPDADTEAGYSLGYAAGLRRALATLGMEGRGEHDVTVAGACALLAALGLEMTLAVEPAEEAKR